VRLAFLSVRAHPPALRELGDDSGDHQAHALTDPRMPDQTDAEGLRDQGGFCGGDFDVKYQDLHAGHR
jgi:hypothetical protein